MVLPPPFTLRQALLGSFRAAVVRWCWFSPCTSGRRRFCFRYESGVWSLEVAAPRAIEMGVSSGLRTTD